MCCLERGAEKKTRATSPTVKALVEGPRNTVNPLAASLLALDRTVVSADAPFGSGEHLVSCDLDGASESGGCRDRWTSLQGPAEFDDRLA
eukprot:scaffold5438_cov237-Pinguiococcus_pyrenoidosus.AAC.4